jgi:transposase-like protein
VEVKLLAIDALKAGITSSEVCELIGVSNSALGKWRKLYQEGGEGALALRPKLIIGDEPVSALDVSIRAQGLNLMESLKSEFDLSYIFISHDLSIIQYISDRSA